MTIVFDEPLGYDDRFVFLEIDQSDINETVTFYPVDEDGRKIGDFKLTLVPDSHIPGASADFGTDLYLNSYSIKLSDGAGPIGGFNARGLSFTLDGFNGTRGDLSKTVGFRIEDVTGVIDVDPGFLGIAVELPER